MKTFRVFSTVMLVSTLAAGNDPAMADWQNFYTPPSPTSPQTTDSGLTNPSGSTVLTTNAPAGTLGGTAPPPPVNPTPDPNIIMDGTGNPNDSNAADGKSAAFPQQRKNRK